MDPGCGPAISINRLPGLPKLPQAAKFGVHEMATQIVMDRTGDTRHTFDVHDRAEVEKAERRFRELTGAGFTAAVRIRARRAAGDPRLRSDGGGNAVLSASRWRLTAVTQQIVLRDHARSSWLCLGTLLLSALSLVVARSGSGSQIVPLRNRGTSTDPVEGLALAEAARLLRALPIFRRRRQRHRDALSDTPRHARRTSRNSATRATMSANGASFRMATSSRAMSCWRRRSLLKPTSAARSP